jgi:hypothetical protein
MAPSVPTSGRRQKTPAGVLLVALVMVASGCEDGSEAEPARPGPTGEVRKAAVRTLAAGPASITIRVSSRTTVYGVRGAIDLATARFRLRARVKRAPMTHFATRLRVIGVQGETYQIVDDVQRQTGFEGLQQTGCAFDPHAPVGTFGGAASIQEAVALAGVATRLMRDAPRKVTLLERRKRRAATYRLSVDPSAVSSPDAPRSDEWIVVNPPRLARHLAPMRLTVDSKGLIRQLSLQLRRFPPPASGPDRVARERHRERVSISISLSDFGRRLDVGLPACVAME